MDASALPPSYCMGSIMHEEERFLLKLLLRITVGSASESPMDVAVGGRS